MAGELGMVATLAPSFVASSTFGLSVNGNRSRIRQTDNERRTSIHLYLPFVFDLI